MSQKVETYDNSIMISTTEASTISGVDLAEVRKAIKTASLEAAAELVTGKRGRPPKLYNREELLRAIANVTTAAAKSESTPRIASEIAEELASTSESSDFDSAVG